jgi:4-aminobutyrate aminotransferase/(S)-3-amino-2-methylpropionate transaminase
MIRLKTVFAGPKSRAMLSRRASAVPNGLGKATDVVVQRAEGALVHDVDGNTFIDFVGGIGALAVGHCPPTVVEAMHEEAQQLVHMCSLVGTYESYVRVCELLNEVTPGAFPKKTLLSNSGAEAVENAVKAARAYTRRPAVVCFEGAYHGRTLLTLSLTSKYSLFKKGMGPFAPEIVRLPMPRLPRPGGHERRPVRQLGDQQLEFAFTAQVDPAEVAAIIIEPVQGRRIRAGASRFLQRIGAPRPARYRDDCRRGAVRFRPHGQAVRAGALRPGGRHHRHGRSLGSDRHHRPRDTAGRHPRRRDGAPGGNPLTCVAAIAAIETMRQPAFSRAWKDRHDVARR